MGKMVSDTFFLIIFSLLLGAILGSFLNALIFRYNTGQPLLKAMQGRSRCMRCGLPLGALDLIPVFSWLFLRGRCRYCGSAISPQYPLVEMVMALLSLGIALQFMHVIPYFFWLLVSMIILFLIVYDFRHMILPMGGLLMLAALGLASLFFSCGTHTFVETSPGIPVFDVIQWSCTPAIPSLWQFLAGPLVALPLLLLSLVSRGRWMGWGDGILALPLGWFLGITEGYTSLILAFWIGAIVGIALLVMKSSGLTLKSEIPFGPFLAFGAAVVFFTHFNLFTVLGIY